ALGTYNFRTLGLGYANLGTLLMVWGVPYDSPQARTIAGALTAILTGEAYAISAELSAILGPFPEYAKNREHMLRVIRNHRRAAYDAPKEKYEGLSVLPVAIDQDLCPEGLRKAVHRAWDRALELGEKHGYRNAQVTVIAPTGTIGLQMDCDTTGVEPDFALVKFKKLAGGGYFKIVNQSVPHALKTLGYAPGEIADIVQYVTGTLSFNNGVPHINRETLLAKGCTDGDLGRLEQQLPGVFHLSMAFTPTVLGEELLSRLGLQEGARENPMFDVLAALGFTPAQVEEANEVICGRQTIEGAPHVRPEHLPVFDCANKCGTKGTRFISYGGHVKMLGAVQPFVSGSISKTINMPAEATVEEIERVYWEGWKLGLKANALYRDGSKMSQPLSTKSGEESSANGAQVIERVIEKIVERPRRVKLPRERSAITRKVNLAGEEFYLTVGLYPDGKPGELFITMGKEGSFASGLADAFAKMVSLTLQYGVPIEHIIRQLRHMRFSPDGFTGDPDIPTAGSVVDFLAQWLEKTFPNGVRTEMGKLPLPEDEPQMNAPTAFPPQATKELEDMSAIRNGGPAALSPAPGTVVTFAPSQPIASYGFTGDKCSDCGSLRMVQNGSCKKCLDCGTTTGCS
ncbi:MAG: vitamin B12-dependent ribonucleotide reductase, partial [bacterium]|nr:vitamin B12-dependent ribonucleotide reductase [bacterium]